MEENNRKSRKHFPVHRTRNTILKTLLVLLTLIFLVCAGGVAYLAHLWNKIEKGGQREVLDESGNVIIQTYDTIESDQEIVVPVQRPTQSDPTGSGEDMTEEPTETGKEPADASEASPESSEEPEQPQSSEDEPQPTEAQPTKPQPTEPTTTEAQPTKPQPTEPPTTEPQPTEPPTTEPESSEELPTVIVPTNPTEPTSPTDPVGPGPSSGFSTYVFFGVDARNNSSILHGAQGDVVILCSINKSTNEVRLASVYRDTCLGILIGDQYHFSKITDLYCVYGADAVVSVLSSNLDLNIDGYVAVNWKAVADTIDMMGGLDVNMSAAECASLNSGLYEIITTTGLQTTDVNIMDGVQTLDGAQTVAFCRIRHVGNADFERTERQRRVINLMLAKAKTLGAFKIASICETIFSEIGTNIGFTEIASMASRVRSFDIVDTSGFPYSLVSDGKIYIRGLEPNVSQLHQFLYGDNAYVPSETVRNLQGIFDQLWQYH